MYLQNIHIENYRLLKNIDITLHPSMTLIVGKNNTGKTSITKLIRKVLNEEKNLAFDDYPLTSRKKLYKTMEAFWRDEIQVKDLAEKIDETRISFMIDYREEGTDQPLGGLRPFIIDLDEATVIAQIDAVYAFNKSNAVPLFERCKNRYNKLLGLHKEKFGVDARETIFAEVVKEYFTEFFSLTVFAVNPTNGEDYQEKQTSLLKKLFTLSTIEAERSLDESENHNAHPLVGIMNRVFNSEGEETATDLKEKIEHLNQYIDDARYETQVHIKPLMEQIISGMVKFGYPSAEDMVLRADPDISLKKQILNNTDLTYVSRDGEEELPSTHNGLGYKNLIKMTLLLTEFAREVQSDTTTIPLLLIEEPEAHMHPQMQTTFVSFLENFLQDAIGAGRYAQVILSSHSSHIANTVSFERVRYMQRQKDYVICKNLQDFSHEETNVEFLQKYLKMSYCDLYFCDKAILIEGASERLLLPKMIMKCVEAGDFKDSNPNLQSQYCAIIEVGGAYAHRFYDFVDFLEIPTLILTDIDFVEDGNKKCQRGNAVRSSNGAINHWCRDAFSIKGTKAVPIETIMDLTSNPQNKTKGFRHIEFQNEENGFHPRSLEEAIQNVNREMFEISEDKTDIPLFEEGGKHGSKTDFAILLLTDPLYEDFKIPSYIREGLIWLNEQSKMSDFPRPYERIDGVEQNAEGGEVSHEENEL